MTKKTKAELVHELEGLKRDLQNLNESYKEAEIYMRWYRNLRKKEVIVMEEEGALYLKGEDLDAYCRKITPSVSRAELLKELLPGLNVLFGKEYKKYAQEHAQHVKAHMEYVQEVFNVEKQDGNDA